MASKVDKKTKRIGGCHPHTLARLPRTERLNRIGMLIDSQSWHKLPLLARENYLDMLFSEQ